MSPSKPFIANLHGLRAVAASSVVYLHASDVLHLYPSVGTFGVDVFFVISGFIIPYIAAQNSDGFLLRRIIRIVPFYWSATLLVFVLARVLPSIAPHTPKDLPALLAAMFFIPHALPNGDVAPILPLGWTLNYEMYFYLAFAVAMRASKKWAPVITAAVILAIMAAVDVSGTSSVILGFYGKPIVLEFLFGIAAFYAFSALPTEANRYGWLAVAALMIIAAGFLPVRDFDPNVTRWLWTGLPALVIVLGALALERTWNMSIHRKLLILLGEASYILYLSHPYAVGAYHAIVWPRIPHSLLLTIISVLIIMGASALASVALHLWFEKPIMRALRSVMLSKPVAEASNFRHGTVESAGGR
jgi:peptidoglycan/LPS O-acetylase OafA/YrhL